MLKKICSLFILFPFALFGQTKQFDLKGKINPFFQGEKAYLTYRTPSGMALDSVLIEKGRFEFTGNMENDGLNKVSLALKTTGAADEKGSHIELLIKITDTVSIDIHEPMITSLITGSNSSIDFVKLMAIQKALNVFSDEAQRTWVDFINRNNNDKVAFDIFKRFYQGLDYSKSNINTLRELFMLFSDKTRHSEDGLAFLNMINLAKSVVIGAAAPPINTKDINGASISLNDFKGKYILVDFWASWCIPCRNQFPELKLIYGRYKMKNFEILGYSIDTEQERWHAAVEHDGIQWKQVSLLKGFDDPAATKYLVQSVPDNYLIDPEGKIIAHNISAKDIEILLENLIK